jgi:CelD/BcsL family acetyltransferase involved in cellulose biosynthesis
MQIEIIRQEEQFEALAGEWNALLDISASRVPFLCSEYLAAWWRTRGGGEWPGAELWVGVGRSASGDLMGIAPLFFAPNPAGEPALLLLGSIEISDYLDFLARPEDLPEFCSALLQHLEQAGPPGCRLLDLYNLPEDSPTLLALEQAALGLGWEFSQEFLQNCPWIPLSGDWETYLAGIDKKQRHEIRRKLRRAEEHLPVVRWYQADSAEGLDGEVDAFFKLMEFDLEKERFLTPQMREQMRETIHTFYRLGNLQLAFIEVGGEKAAAYLNLDYQDRIWVYNSGYNPAFRDVSPGWVLLAYLIQWAIENQRRAFDFMRGDEEYKYRFGAQDSRVVRAQIRCR